MSVVFTPDALAPVVPHAVTEELLLGVHSKKSGSRMWSYLHLVGAEAPVQKAPVAEWVAGKTEVLSGLGPIRSIRESL